MSIRDLFETEGRVWFRSAVSKEDLRVLEDVAGTSLKAGQRLDMSEKLRGCLSIERSIGRVIAQIDPDAKPVRAVSFNKSQQTNWGVPWHQDRVIAVRARENVSGFGNWSFKAGGWHCEPPLDLLETMLFVRIHLDDTDCDNGSMSIALGSHMEGTVRSGQAEEIAQKYEIETCEAKRGDILVLKMLTLHASGPSRLQTNRRVLRVDFSSFELPKPMCWL